MLGNHLNIWGVSRFRSTQKGRGGGGRGRWLSSRNGSPVVTIASRFTLRSLGLLFFLFCCPLFSFFLSLFPFSGSPSSPLASFLYNSTQDDGDATKRTFTSIKPSFGRHFPSLLFIIALLFPAVCLWALTVRYGLFAYANLPGPISVQREREPKWSNHPFFPRSITNPFRPRRPSW